MKPGQIAQLQELARCWNVPAMTWVDWTLLGADVGYKMDKQDKRWLRRLWHAYRGQIAAMRKNRKAGI
jgi:hypothetical protein